MSITKLSEFSEEESLLMDEPDFLGPTIDEIFDENPCLLEIGPLNLNKLIYGDWLKTTKDPGDMTEEEAKHYEEIVSARNEVANNFMQFFNIQHKHGRH